MKKQNYHFGVIGGDDRLVYTARKLLDYGCFVTVYNLSAEAPSCPGARRLCQAESMRQLCSSCRLIIGPAPFTKDRQNLFCKKENAVLSVQDFLDSCQRGAELFAGSIPDSVCKGCAGRGIAVHDFMKEESLALRLSIAAAEGAIAEAIVRQKTNLCASRCLVLGYGRLGMALADRLAGLHACVHVLDHREDALAKALSLGFPIVRYGQLPECISSYEYIFNTVPACLLTEKCLCHASAECIVIDLASMPGGVDYDAAGRLSVRAVHALGLPGIYAPVSSGYAIAESILSSLESCSS